MSPNILIKIVIIKINNKKNSYINSKYKLILLINKSMKNNYNNKNKLKGN